MSTLRAELPPGLWERWISHSADLLNSYHKATGRDLMPRGGDAHAEAERLLAAPFVVVSHGTEDDPILNYGNRVALALWEMTPAQLIATPSRLTAEAPLREAREQFLAQAARDGFVHGYEGVRISATGRRFQIANATIWNVTDDAGHPAGQAATFGRWTFL
ncbi:MEKHLA domain-containing protein [Methylocystis iwaonis]|uniref:MEKHLA domain-containing protein n=1 Tax=Methylocystis iwaonis TaxID=2885079 RepID=UPI002E7AD060|nr:MEKHLA domain-containing protein [Methylocystis iwaonis]